MFKLLNYYLSALISPKIYWTIAGLIHPYQAVLENSPSAENVYQRSTEIVNLLNKFKLINNTSKVLDIGCGVGRAEYLLKKYVHKCVGVDISPSMIKLACQNIQENNVDFKVVNGKDLSIFKNNNFDLVFSILVFQHLPRENFQKYLIESHRVLKPKGKLFFQISINDNNQIKEPIKNHPWALRYYTIPQLRQLLQKNSFNNISFYGPSGNKLSKKDIQALVLAENI